MRADGATADGAATGGAFPLVHPPGFCAAADETLRDAGRRRRGDVAKRGAGLQPVAAAAPAGDAEPPSWTSLRFDESSARAMPGAGAADAADAGAEDAMDATDAEDATDAMDATDATFAMRRNVPSTTTTSPRARPPTKCFVSRFAASPFGGARRRRDDAAAEITKAAGDLPKTLHKPLRNALAKALSGDELSAKAQASTLRVIAAIDPAGAKTTLIKFTGDKFPMAARRAALQGLVGQKLTALQAKGFGPITTEIIDAPEFYFAEDYHQQYLAKNPAGYCGLGGTGVACPVPAAMSGDAG